MFVKLSLVPNPRAHAYGYLLISKDKKELLKNTLQIEKMLKKSSARPASSTIPNVLLVVKSSLQKQNFVKIFRIF
jgi:hypothetical protein